ncbi:ABC transporter ATP-binding protein, partial [Fusobacterium necrophorum]|nr:ABC transporter ATP-binding protein [Fusobacterium necrophorum]
MTCFILYLTIIDIFNGSLNMNGVVKYTAVCLVSVILRILVYRKSYLMSFENSFEITGELRIKLANHFRKLSLG